MRLTIKQSVTGLLMLLPVLALADINWVNATGIINNIDTINAQIKQKVPNGLEFPNQIPKPAKQLYASAVFEKYRNLYEVEIETMPNCHGVKSCNAGSLIAALNRKVQSQVDMRGNKISKIVKLANQQTAYFTPAHAAGDFWPPMIQWQYKKITYTLIWNGDFANADEQQAALVQMANSTLK